MVSIDDFRRMALSFEQSTEEPHRDKVSFRIKKKIFATLNVEKKQAVLKLSEVDQSVFCDYHDAFEPVPGGWGKQGWTIVYLTQVKKGVLQDAITTAYCQVAPEKLAAAYKPPD